MGAYSMSHIKVLVQESLELDIELAEAAMYVNGCLYVMVQNMQLSGEIIHQLMFSLDFILSKEYSPFSAKKKKAKINMQKSNSEVTMFWGMFTVFIVIIKMIFTPKSYCLVNI